MRYTDVYKFTLAPASPVTIGVYELSQDIFIDSTYQTTRTIQVHPTRIGVKSNFTPQVADSVLRIRLDNAFGQKFINASATVNMRSQEEFIKLFKGLQVVPEYTPNVNEGSILSFGRTATAITVYYKESGVAAQNQFIVNNNSATINHSTLDYSGTPVGTALASPQQNFETVYLQGLGGVNASVRIPNLKDILPGGNIVINKASLIIPVDLSASGYLPPTQIFAVQFDSVRGTVLSIPDVLVGDAYFGGKFTAATNEYRINIGRFVQANRSNPTINPLYLFPANPAANPGRAILRGGAAEENQMRLEIIYTNP
ncbi:MAG: DUF4270 family protein, partial [Bacteroidetes bacterium]|nr:DUF4270 family protein [Bacteroidota bacterium]